MNETNRKLQEGDKYLSIIIEILGQKFNVAAFENKEKTGNQPDYKGKDIAIWIQTKKYIDPNTTEEIIEP